MSFQNMMAGPPATLLPDDPEPRDLLAAGTPAAQVAAGHPEFSLAWASLADDAYSRGAVIESYAYARTGYHRGLDQLRRHGWKGFGPVPYSHEPNRGFLRCVAALARAADNIGETDEFRRCLDLIDDCDPEARKALGF